MRRQQMIRKAIRSGVTALAVAFFAVPQVSLAQAANDQVQVDPLMQKAARIKNMNAQMRITHAQRVEAAKEQKATVERVKAAKAAARAKGIEVPDIALKTVQPVKPRSGGTQARVGAPRSTAAELPAGMTVGPLSIYPDYFTTANWAFSPMLRKFVDTLPPLGLPGVLPNALGNILPIAVPDTTTYPGSDYYVIELRQYTHQFHSDLTPTVVRGYVQVNNGTDAAGQNTVTPPAIAWLGPVILSQKDRPTRVLFRNMLPGGAAGNLAIPVDESIQGSGKGAKWADPARANEACDPSPPGINLYGQDCALYPQTRAAIHLHGGRTPWISDGTPHQWILPLDDFNDPNNPYKQGVSLYNVPDMPVPAAANETTYYWSNQQSARLMFYHDHAWGITRLNVLAGEAAGLVITDPTEQTLMAEGVLPGYGIPLVIQDRTFVNAAINPLTGESFVRDTDPTWNFGTGTPDGTGVRPPVDGDFWIPHVYVPAQNPFTPSGVNAFGRWVYGPWFFPPTANLIYPPVANPYHDANCSDPDPAVLAFCTTPNQPPVIPGTPTPSVGAETFFDTAMVNGQAFPVLDVYEQTYRFRILNAANDRFWNLNLYEADPLQVTHPHWNALPVAQNTEVEMCAIPGLLPNDPKGQVCWDQANPRFANWPNDGRVEGVPNPTKLGPDIVYIGTEGGFLPKPVVLTGQPITFVTDPTAFNVGNVQDFNLFLGPAERADVLIDFTGWGGKELILYNDAPAAVPAFDPRFDYITGAADLSANGGYGRVPPWNEATPGAALEGPQIGYGPNTRTVMKIRVTAGLDPVAPGGPLNVAALEARWAPAAGRVSVFEASQDPIIVGQADYDGVYASNPTFPSVWPAWGISRIEDNSLMFETVGGTIVTFPMEPKAMHDEMGASFDKEYARMSTNLGTQLNPPKTNAANMTPFMYTDPATEFMNAALEPISPVLGDGTQLWKISHNGVDMHPIHFHIFDVQVINRVGWDGQIRLPAPQELGWKDTVRIAPLEDTIVAMRPWTPPMPFSIPFSWRVLNPAIPVGSGYGFTNIDPITQAPLVPPTTNILTSFAWEYVWHCHILSHEENDMMRPIVLNVVSTIPPAFAAAPTLGAFSSGYDVTWVDPTPVVYTEAAFQTSPGFGNAASEIGFRVRRNTNLLAPDPLVGSTWVEVCTARANQTTCKDTTAVNGTYYVYKVQAFNEAGITDSPLAQTAVQTSTITRVALAQAPTSTTWTKNNTTTNVPVYTATAQTGAGTVASPYVNAQAEYRFTSTTGGVTTIVRDWSASNTWTMPLNTAGSLAGISYQINALARNATGGTPATSATPTRATPTSALVATTRTILVRITAPATGVSFTTITPPSPQTFGLSSLFTATATGGTYTTATNQNKQFQFSTSIDGGTTWTVVSPWALGTRVGTTGTTTARSWTMPGTQPLGTYLVKVDVRTNVGDVGPTASTTYVVQNNAASGVTLALGPGVLNPGPAPVSFLATGSGAAGLSTATGGGYFYRFLVDGAETQPWGTSRVYTLPAGTVNGTYIVTVEVRTSTSGAAQASTFISYEVNNGATVSFTSFSPTASPGIYGTPVTFTATGASAPAGSVYQYRFTLDGGTPTTWSTTNTFVMDGTALGGSHTVLVEVSVAATPVTAASSATTTYVINYPSANGVTINNGVPGSAQFAGTNVTFTAAGSSTATLPLTAYKYQFALDGGAFGAWGSSPTYVMNAPAGNHTVSVNVTTENTPATVQGTATSATYTLTQRIQGSIAPASLTFAAPQGLNTTSGAQVVTVSNAGIDPLAISSIGFTGANAAEFSQTTTCGASVAAGGSCTISVSFRPTATGARTANLVVTTNDPVNPLLSVGLSGTGTALMLSATSLTFGDQPRGTTSATQSITFTNTSAVSLTWSLVEGGDSREWLVATNGCPIPMPAGRVCTFSFTLKPPATGTMGVKIKTVQFNTSQPVSGQVVTATGNVIP